LSAPPQRRPGFVPLAGALAFLAACSQQPPAKTAASNPADRPVVDGAEAAGTPSPAAPQEAAPAPAPPQGAPATAEEPERVWLSDDEGRQYYVEPIEKSPGRYQFVGENRVMLLGAPVDIAGHDDRFFYVKVYRIDPTVVRPSGRRPEPTAEELAEAAATYLSEVTSADRLRFAPFDGGLPKGGQWRNGFDVADMNGDGHPDIVHGPPRKSGGAPVVLLGDGRGGWKHWPSLRVPRPYDYGDAAVADFNGDGHPDIALAIHLRGLKVLVGDGNGDFQEWSQGIDYEIPGQGGSGAGFSSRSIRAADWNGDGRPDLIALGEGPRPANPTAEERRRGLKTGGMLLESDGAVLFLNQGDGTWVKRDEKREAMEIFGDYLAVGDFDGNGRVDFATASNMMGRRDLVNLGQEDEAWQAVDLPLRPGGYVRAVAAADFDGDGRDDLAVAYLAYQLGIWRNGIDLHYSQPEGRWQRRVLAAREGREAIYALDVGDLDGDGALDLFAADSDGGALVFRGDGKGFFVAEESPELQRPVGNCRAYRVRLADLDGDRRDEVVVNFADEPDALFDPDRCPSGGGLAAWKLAIGTAASSR
jgi:hypothetical protein